MADVTISSLPLGTPSGNALLPYSTGSNTLGVSVSAILQNAGNIGIGTNNPSQKLDVYGGGAFTFVEVGKSGQTGNRFAYVDLTSDDTYTDYGFRILRGNTGANTDTSLINRGSGLLIVAAGQATAETGQVAISTANTERMRIDSSGNVGIGTATPTAKLDVVGDVRATNTPKAWCSFTGRSTNGLCTISKQYNVASVNRNSVGNYTVTFTNQLDGTHHMVIGTANAVSNVSYDSPIFNSGIVTTSTSFSVSIVNGPNTGIYDPTNGAGIVVYG